MPARSSRASRRRARLLLGSRALACGSASSLLISSADALLGPRRAIAGLLCVALLLSARAAAACPDDEFQVELVRYRFAIVPRPTHGIGLELWSRGLSGGWRSCGGVAHHLDGIEFEAPDAADRGQQFIHVGGYRAEVPVAGAHLVLGAWLVTRWGDVTRFVTPVIGVRVEPAPDLRVRAEVSASGAYVLAYDPAPRRLFEDVAVSASAVWPAHAATRGEVRARARAYRTPMHDRRDLTLTAGLGLALAARGEARGVPGFVGLAARVGDDPALLVVAELAYGVDGP